MNNIQYKIDNNIALRESELNEAIELKMNIEKANVSEIDDFSFLFHNEEDFNQDISSWDVSKGKKFNFMFEGAINFNQDISSWDVSNGEDFYGMFYTATSFNQVLKKWNIKKDAITIYMFDSIEYYEV